MKRCPACKRLEPDDALTFCRADGTPLVVDSGSVGESAGTMKFGSVPVVSESETSILPQTITDGGINRPTAPTTALPAQQKSGTTRAPAKPQQRKAVIAVVALFAVALAAAGYFYLSRTSGTAIESVAVLPFENQNRDSDTDYLSDGVTESIINSLTQLPDPKVIARSSVFRYKGKATDPIAVGKELGVRAVLTGRIMQRGDTVTVSTELVDVSDNKQLWGEQYNAKVSDLISLPREIAAKITSNLRLKISGEEHNRLMKQYTANPEAYQDYLKGRYFWNKRTAEGIKKSIEYFQQAVDLDPNYALAYSGLADAYSTLPGYSGTPQIEAGPKAKAAAARAIELDRNLAEAHASVAYTMFAFDNNLPGAEKEFQLAIELNPNYPTAHHRYALLLGLSGRNDEARREILRAQQLDPLALIINRTVGNVYFWGRQYDLAIEQFKKTLEIDPNFPPAHEDLAVAYGMKGRYEEAIPEMNKAIALNGRLPHYVAVLGYSYGKSGNKGEAQKILDELHLRAKTEDVSPYDLALVYASLGDKEKTFEMLEEAVRKRVIGTNAGLRLGPAWDGLRSDPRFAELMRRAELPQ
ncbi:MAG: tetratricopeptide repeat protein [Pyrinomonadaceae bacterium]